MALKCTFDFDYFVKIANEDLFLLYIASQTTL